MFLLVFLKVFFHTPIDFNTHCFNELFRIQRCRFKRLQTYNLFSICKAFLEKLFLFFFREAYERFPRASGLVDPRLRGANIQLF